MYIGMMIKQKYQVLAQFNPQFNQIANVSMQQIQIQQHKLAQMGVEKLY